MEADSFPQNLWQTLTNQGSLYAYKYKYVYIIIISIIIIIYMYIHTGRMQKYRVA